MCQILAIAGVKPEKQRLMWAFLQAATTPMTFRNNDGLGYAAMGPKGIWGERWFDVTKAWIQEYRKPFTQKDKEFEKKYNGLIESTADYNNFGNGAPKNNNPAVIYHARFATCERNLANVHPFVRDNTALIHNGVIGNHANMEKLTSTCDSEVILNQYITHDVTNNVDNIQEVVKRLSGSYGCALLTIDKNGKRYLDLFRHVNPIYVCYVEDLGTAVYCTSSITIEEACKKLKFKYGGMFQLKVNHLLRLDADTGEILFSRKFDPTHDWTTRSSTSGGSTEGKSTATEPNSTESEKVIHLNPPPAQEEVENKRADEEEEALGYVRTTH